MLSVTRPLLAVYMKLLYSRYRNELFWNVTTVFFVLVYSRYIIDQYLRCQRSMLKSQCHTYKGNSF
jgi:hypothetical protein